MTDLSIIIVSYNTRELTKECLNQLKKTLAKTPRLHFQIIVVDNGSSDDSVAMLKQQKVQLIVLSNNVGFGRANNQGLKLAQGKYILFLNSDVLVDNIDFRTVLDYLDRYPEVGVLTVKVNLVNGKIDPASHRGFPTLWRSFCYFLGLERLFGNFHNLSELFGGYHLLSADFQSVHEIDSPSGAFYLTRKQVIEKVGGFDERFFMYGEDLDLSLRIKQAGYKIIYYPLFSVTHLKSASGLNKPSPAIRHLTRRYFYEAMIIFYQKHYSKNYPRFIGWLVKLLIEINKRLAT